MKQDLHQHLDKVFDQRGRAAGSGVNVFVLVEMDDFRRMSASLGLETAELLVGAFHERVRGFLRTCDQHIVISDERCGVILSEIQNMEQLDLAAAKLFRQFEAPIEVIDRSFKVTLFAAFVVPTKARTGAAQLLDEGERGLFEARSTNNRYTVVKLDKKNVDVVDDWQAQQEVEEAFERGEFHLYFQPKVHAVYRSTVGAEALLRWASPQRGLTLPGFFMPDIERSAIIKPVTWYCIRSAAATCRHWPKHVSVAINVAPNVLVDDEIVQVLQDTLGLYELAGERLTIEVTENAMMEDPLRCFDILRSIRSLSVKVSIDDFGTGYSSLAYFRNLPADELKIDRSFVAAMHNSPQDASLIKSIVDIARNFGLQVVAEGIEDETTADALKDLGCDVLQGLLFGEPCAGRDFDNYLDGKPADFGVSN
ncbi:MAG: EAL domain-containing protein [Gammaproteobacteria bacterium]|nr:EAL domain-containing protein [Gammaproteobacteria bacterium]